MWVHGRDTGRQNADVNPEIDELTVMAAVGPGSLGPCFQRRGHLILKSLVFKGIHGGRPWLLRLAATSLCGETQQSLVREALPSSDSLF
jgi:hypothetical protein